MLGGLGSSFLWPLSIRTSYMYILTRQSCPHSSSLLLAVNHLIGLHDYELFVVLCLKAQPPLWRLDRCVSVHRIGRLHSLARRGISGILSLCKSVTNKGPLCSQLTPRRRKLWLAFNSNINLEVFLSLQNDIILRQACLYAKLTSDVCSSVRKT